MFLFSPAAAQFFLSCLLLAACLALGQSSAIYGSPYGSSYATVPVVRQVGLVRHIPVVQRVSVVEPVSVPVPVVHSVVPVHRAAYISSPSVVRVGGVYDSPLAYGGWLKQKK